MKGEMIPGNIMYEQRARENALIGLAKAKDRIAKIEDAASNGELIKVCYEYQHATFTKYIKPDEYERWKRDHEEYGVVRCS